MAELVTLLGTLSVLLTLVGTYRLASFFLSGGSALAGMTALAVTVGFLMLFEQIILVVGLSALLAPVGAAVYWRDRLPVGGGGGGDGDDAQSSGTGSTTGSGAGTTGTGGGAGGSAHSAGTRGNAGGAAQSAGTSGTAGSASQSGGTGGTRGGGGGGGTLVCSNCGTANDPTANFCENDQCLQRLNG